MKVLVSDNLGEIGIQLFKQEEGIEVDVKTGLPPEALRSIIGEYDALVVRSATKVTEDLLQAATRLKVVGRAGIGLDNVDIPAATKRGIAVMNTPGGNVVTTAEHTIAMMMALTRNIPRGTASLKAQRWDKKLLQGREIFNKTLGVIGFGKIGAVVADRARGLKMRVIVSDPHVTPERIEKSGFESVTLEELYAQADYITVHVPKLSKTTGLLNKDAFARMKDGVMILNCARGGIVNQDDLYEAMMAGKVAGAALDVFETEPPGDLPLLQMDNVIGTPHLGASTKEAQTNVAVAVAKQIIAYLKTGTVINAVNVPSVTGELLEKLSPYLKLADALGCIQAQFCQGPFEEIAIEYKGDFHGLDLSPVTTALIKGFLTPLVTDEVNSVNAPVIAQDMGIKVTETTTAESEDYLNLITVRIVSPESSNLISGTIFGKKDPRIVRINKFRMELIVRKGYFVLINNYDKPGAIGSIGTVMGSNNINISRMQVGQEEGGNRTLIFIRVDQPIPDDILEALRQLPMVISATPFEL